MTRFNPNPDPDPDPDPNPNPNPDPNPDPKPNPNPNPDPNPHLRRLLLPRERIAVDRGVGGGEVRERVGVPL